MRWFAPVLASVVTLTACVSSSDSLLDAVREGDASRVTESLGELRQESKQQTLDRALWEATGSYAPERGIVRALIEAGANVNLRRFGDVLVVRATRFRNRPFLQLLIDHGADPDLQESVLLYVEDSKNVTDSGESTYSLKSDRVGKNALYHAIRDKRLDLVELFVRSGADVNARMYTNELSDFCPNDTVLSKAVYEIQILEGADIALHFGSGENSGYWRIVDGIVTTTITQPPFNRYTTPLLEVIAVGDSSVVKFLFDSGADVHGVNQDGQTPLSLASSSKTTELADILRGYGARR